MYSQIPYVSINVQSSLKRKDLLTANLLNGVNALLGSPLSLVSAENAAKDCGKD